MDADIDMARAAIAKAVGESIPDQLSRNKAKVVVQNTRTTVEKAPASGSLPIVPKHDPKGIDWI